VDIKTGRFSVSPDRLVLGELRLAGRQSQLILRDEDYFHVDREVDLWLTGTLYDLQKVTLADCLLIAGTSTTGHGDARSYSAEVFPHFGILGRTHIRRDDSAISSVSFTFDDAATLFYDFDAFGTVIDAGPHIQSVAAANKSATGSDRSVRIGEMPLIAYFTGETLISQAPTVIGEVRAEHYPSWTMGGPEGIRIDNEIWVSIRFQALITFSEAIARTLRLLQFIQLAAGRPQNVPSLRIAVSHLESEEMLDVYWSHHPRRPDEYDRASGRPHPADLPLDPIRRSTEFQKVLTWWLAAETDRQVARNRFSSSFALQTSYSADRLIGAANAFDLLPDSAIPKKVSLSQELQDAKRQAQALFDPLPESFERASMLGAIGRIGNAALKHKVRHRVAVLRRSIGNRFPELEGICAHAVDRRNFFVHGGPLRVVRGGPEDNMPFLTDTLEFVFAASELVEGGWDAARFVAAPTTMTHPFGAYKVSYAEQLRGLRDQSPNL